MGTEADICNGIMWQLVHQGMQRSAYAALPHAGIAQETQEPTSVWLYSLNKAITYETAANLADIPLYSTVLVGAQAGTTINVVTAFAAYYSMKSAGTCMAHGSAIRRRDRSQWRSRRRCFIAW